MYSISKPKLYLSIAIVGLATSLAGRAEVYTISDFSHNANTSSHFDFGTDWSGTPGIDNIAGEDSLYVKFTVSWSASSDPGDFIVRYALDDGGGRSRADADFRGGATQIYLANANGDGDGAGPATVQPTITIDTNSTTSVTFVMKVDQTKPSPGGDWNYGTIGAQDNANAFLYVDPNLGTTEANNSTILAGWRSGQSGYDSLSFVTNNLESGNSFNFSNITLYTGSDTPFGTISAVADAATSTVSVSPTAVPADDTTTATVIVTVNDDGSNPLAGKEVSLAGNGSATISTANPVSDVNGEVVFTVRSAVVGAEEFTATVVTDGNLVITDTASVDFQEVVPVGPVDPGQSSVASSPDNVIANGISSSTVTVTLRDSIGQLVTGEDVTLSGSPSNATIGPAPTLTTDANGEAAFTVSSSTIGTVVFSATSSTDSVTVTQTASVDFTDPQDAESFNVNFLDEGQADATGLIGVVGDPGETWNQGIGTTGSPVSSLLDTTGTVTSSVSVSGLGSDGRTLNSADLTIFNGVRNVFGKGSDVTLSITGLTPDATYDLYIYSLSHNASPWGDIANSERSAGDFVTTNTVIGNGQSQFLDNGVTGTSDDVFVPNGNYVTFESIVADESGDITILVDAYDGDGDRGSVSTRLHVNGLQIRPTTGASADYNAWRDGSYPGLGLPGDDDDGDSLSNDFERIYGLDPTDAASANPYTASLDPNSGSFGYTRRLPSLVNLNYKVWYSTDLEEWFEDNAANQTVQSVNGEIEVMGVSIDPALLTEERLFVQVRASEITGVDPEPSLVNLWGSGDTITLLFSEPMNPSAAGNPANYSVVEDGIGNLAVLSATPSADGGSVTLTLSSTLGLDTGYTVDIDGVTSGTGQALGVVSRQFTTWDDDPNGIKVFIVAGQSNMVGFGETERGNGDVTGEIGSLRYRVLNNGLFPDYDYTSLVVNPSDTSSAFRTRSDVKVWYRDGGNGQLGGAIKKGDLGPPFMGRDTGKIGPEFAFGQVLGDFYSSDDVLIVKCAWGGRDLAEKFRPPTAVADRGGQVGDFFSATIDYTRQVLANLATEFPEWSGQGYEIVGFGWHQGYNDRINAAFSAEYKDNLPDLIEDLREVFNKPDLPVVVASTGMATGAAEAPPYAGYSQVEQAQLWVAGVAQPANVLSTDTRPFMRDVGDSPADQGFHWNQNGETYFMMGKAMGDNMVNLLSP